MVYLLQLEDIGMMARRTLTNLSLTREGRWWTEKFPPMPTKRYAVSALCTGMALIVAGGVNGKIRPLRAVEVLNTETQYWHIAPDQPQSLSESSLTL